MADDLALGATSTVASGGAQPQAQQNQGAMLQLLQRMLQQRQQQGGGQGGLVNFGPQAMQPQAPTRMGTPDINYPNRSGGYQTKGERQRDEKASLFHGIASTVRTASDYMQDKKVREMSLDTSRLITAMQGYEAAKQSGDANAAKTNAEIINDMMSDPKKVKQFQKAFNVNLLGESKDKDSVEYKGFIEAFKKYKSGESDLNPQAQRFVQSRPQTAQLNAQAQAQAQAIKDKVLPDANTQVKAGVDQEKNMVDVMKIIGTSSDKELVGDRLMKVAQMRAESTDKRVQGAIDVQILKNFGSAAVAKVRSQSAAYIANKHYEGIETNQKYNMLRDIQKGWDKKDMAADPNIKALNGLMINYDKEIKNLNEQLKVAEKAGDTPRIELLGKQMEAAKNLQTGVVNAYEKRVGPIEEPDDNKDGAAGEPDKLSPEEQSVFDELFKDE